MKRTKFLKVAIPVFILLGVYFYEQQNTSDNKQFSEVAQPDTVAFNYLPIPTTKQIVKHQFYTLSYHEKHEQAEWVAYHLEENQLINANFKRPYFVQDNKVVTKSADWRNYKKSGYDKGHLCPAADREFSQVAYNETFLTSNIAPQLHDFNAGIWNRLEQKTRYWAKKHKSVYVITGGILTDDLPSIGAEQVSVPKYFYKILMNNSDGDYKMIAFLIPHQKTDKALYEYVVTVDEIEKKTGIDFFPALPNSIENRLESQRKIDNWTF